jgi:hypothetical protein
MQWATIGSYCTYIIGTSRPSKGGLDMAYNKIYFEHPQTGVKRSSSWFLMDCLFLWLLSAIVSWRLEMGCYYVVTWIDYIWLELYILLLCLQ